MSLFGLDEPTELPEWEGLRLEWLQQRAGLFALANASLDADLRMPEALEQAGYEDDLAIRLGVQVLRDLRQAKQGVNVGGGVEDDEAAAVGAKLVPCELCRGTGRNPVNHHLICRRCDGSGEVAA